jgi:alpha-amylase
MRKGSNGSQIITVVSNVGAEGGEYSLTVTGGGYTAGTVLTELITCTKVTVGDGGDISVPMDGGLPSVLYPASKLNGTGSPC